MYAATVEEQRRQTSRLVTRGHLVSVSPAREADIIRENREQAELGGLKEADRAACSQEHVKLGQQPHLGILPAEWKRQRAPAVHMEEGNPIPARPQRFSFIRLFFYTPPTPQTGGDHGHRNTGGTARPLHFAQGSAVDLIEWGVR